MSNWKDYAKLHFIVGIWGFTAILGKLISIPSVELVFYRTLVAALALGLLLYYRKRSFNLGLGQVTKLFGTGLLISAHWILFFGAARVSTVSVCLAGMATCSLWTSIIEPLTNGRRIRLFEVGLGAIAVVGLYVIFQFEFNHALGLLMAIGAAFLAALFSVINGKFTKKHNPFMITFYEMVGATIGTILFFPIYSKWLTTDGLQLNATKMDWLLITILAVICTVYAYSAAVELQKRMSAFIINLTVNLEPVYGIIMAVLFFKDAEEMTYGFYAGTGLILLSVLSYPVLNRISKRRAMKLQNY
ncbi:DMT family transporter [Xanthovirga aplysinae]|uniref:DMT family transporter n=1 Tax=Xanthovirga aplysinae TaxID=2529853 RepID=UPI0012BB4B6E|nr:DMT family transporter [Xanthovirga aplysinae]MTI31588.1 EamA family transporter [Xanthovirga aplysinae]